MISLDEIENLINTCLSIQDKLKIVDDHVEFTGSMNDAEDFKELVHCMWFKSLGW